MVGFSGVILPILEAVKDFSDHLKKVPVLHYHGVADSLFKIEAVEA